MEISTIGLAGRSAEDFFQALISGGITRLMDVRLNNTSQLAGYSKRGDLQYFLRSLANIDYRHELLLAPTPEMLADYKKRRIDWAMYAERYTDLLRQRDVAQVLQPADFDRSCLLCAERLPQKCHRRLAADYLARAWDSAVVHL